MAAVGQERQADELPALLRPFRKAKPSGSTEAAGMEASRQAPGSDRLGKIDDAQKPASRWRMPGAFHGRRLSGKKLRTVAGLSLLAVIGAIGIKLFSDVSRTEQMLRKQH